MSNTLDWLPAVEHDHETNAGPTGLRSFPYTDTGNGERLTHQFAGEIRYSHPQRTWFTHTGRRWELELIRQCVYAQEPGNGRMVEAVKVMLSIPAEQRESWDSLGAQ